jgi:hypothetical protein
MQHGATGCNQNRKKTDLVASSGNSRHPLDLQAAKLGKDRLLANGCHAHFYSSWVANAPAMPILLVHFSPLPAHSAAMLHGYMHNLAQRTHNNP